MAAPGKPQQPRKPKPLRVGPPTIAELIKDPKKRAQLTLPQMVAFRDHLLEMVNAVKNIKALPKDPAAFAKLYSGGRYQTPKHIQHIAERLALVREPDSGHVAISMPPRHGKSTLAAQWLPLWFLARFPRKRVIYVTYETDLAVRWGRRVRNCIRDFGIQVGLKLTEDSTSASRWDLVTGGGMEAVGARGAITGKGADLFIYDDPSKDLTQLKSKTFRDDMWERFLSVMTSRLEPGGKIVITSTRWHEDDLIGRIISESAKHADSMPFDFMVLPALAEEADPLNREIDEPLWPERWPLNALQTIKATTTPYLWAGLYQQRPTPPEGNAVRRAWWQFYDVLPDSFDQLIQTWDLALTASASADYTVGLVLGRKGSRIYVIDMMRGQWDPERVMQEVKATTRKHPLAIAKVIEASSMSKATIAMLHKELLGILPLPTGNKNKEMRLATVVPLIAAGNVYLPKQAPWTMDLVEECAAFPTGTHDDIVDALSQGLTYLMFGSYASADAARRRANQLQPPTTVEEIQQRQFADYAAKVKHDIDRRFNRPGLKPSPFNYPSDSIWPDAMV